MNLDEAIEHNKEIKKMLTEGHYHTEKPEAIQLGIEALEREIGVRSRIPKSAWMLLPSETEGE